MREKALKKNIRLSIGIVFVTLFLYWLHPGVLFSEQKISADLLSVSFPSEREGWTCGRWGTIMHTSDGGRSWIQQPSGTDYTLTAISFVNDQTGWAVGDGGTIIHTSNGGKTWQKQKSPVPIFLMGACFVDENTGWAVGEKTTILYTSDGGERWEIQFQEQEYILKSVSFCDSRNGWAVGEYGFVYHTENAGANWTQQCGGFGFSEETGDLVAGNILFSVVAVSPKIAWAVGIDGYVANTIDGGINWQTVEKGIPKTHLFGIAVSGGDIVVCGNSYILASADGGNTFNFANTTPDISYGWFYGVARKENAGFVSVGKEGWIYLTDNNALSWRLAEK